MISISLEQLAQILGRPAGTGAADVRIAGVTIDSRGDNRRRCFFAIRGERFDGHDFVAQAAVQGALCAVVEREVESPIPLIRVEDTVEALGRLAAWHRGRLSARVVAITGSAGKTTTRHLLHQVLSTTYRCFQARKSFNNHIGVPLTLLEAGAEDEVLLVELGSNHPGEIAPLARMVRPDIAVITHVAPVHLEGFGSVEAIIREKASIAQGLGDGGRLIVSGDCDGLADWVRSHSPVPLTTVGLSEGCDVRAQAMQCGGTRGQLIIDGQTIDVPLAGRAALQNVLTVWSVCRFFGFALSDFAEAVGTLTPAALRMEIRDIGPLTVLADCYNANPASMTNALECLAQLGGEQKRRTVFIASDMAELGETSETLHRQVGRVAAWCGVDLILVTGRYADALLAGAQTPDNANAKKPQTRTFGSVEDLCNNLDSLLAPADIVLVKASRSARLERVVKRLEMLYNTNDR
jgi:UDP-N-acetylmuramoyl-tripeptide--D-alanyl-D-alanine ligase